MGDDRGVDGGACTFSSQRLGDVVAVPRRVAAFAVAAVGAAARRLAVDRWQGELAAWLGEQARVLAGPGDQLDVDQVAWTRLHFPDQQQFLLDSIAVAASRHPGQVRDALERLAALVARQERRWVRAERRWAWPFGRPALD